MRLFGYELEVFARISRTTLKICAAGSFEQSLIVALSEYVKHQFSTPKHENLTSDARHIEFKLVEREDLERIVDLFERYVSERQSFLLNFRNWETHRNDSIRILKEIALRLHKEKSMSNAANVAAGGAGAIGGVIKISQVISNTILPKWMTNTAKCASFLCNSLKLATTSTDYIYVEAQMKTAREAIERDKQNFKCMMSWFRYKNDIIDSIKAAFGSKVTKEFFEALRTFLDKIEEFKRNRVKTSVIISFVTNLFIEPFIRRGLSMSLGLTIGMSIFEILFVYCAHRKWHEAARTLEGLKCLGIDAMYLTNLSMNAQDFSVATPNAMALSGVIDLIPALETAYNLLFNKDSGKSDQGKNLEDTASKLQEELDYFRRLYNQLLANSRCRRNSM